MKKILIIFLFFSVELSSQIYLELSRDTSLTFDEIVTQSEAYFDTRGRGKHTGYKQFKRWEYLTKRSLRAGNKIIPNSEIYKVAKTLNSIPGPTRSAGTWSDLGPASATNTSTWSSHIGRLTGIGLDVNDSNHYIVGSPGGGVWKTTDDGVSWSPIFDNEALIQINSLAISPTNNQVYFSGASGIGMMKSSDGGNTWSVMNGIGTGALINRIIIDPSNSNNMLAANQFGNIYRSTDEGANWTIVMTHSSNIYDLEFKPNDPNVVYASAVGDIFKSTDNGQSFTVLSGPWSNGPMMMAVTPNDNNYLYVLEASGGGFGGLYLSEDSGNTFTTQSDDSSGNNNIMGYDLDETGGQAPRDMDVVVSPTDKSEVHVAGIMTFRSTDSGNNWTQTTHWVISNPLPFVHADIDFLFYEGNKIYVGSDGGLFISTDQGNSFTDKTSGLGIRQFYRIGVAETVVDRVSGGSQDNGTGVLDAGSWTDFVGADGMETFIAKHDEDIIYASIQFGSLYKSVNGGTSLSSISNTPGSGDWVSPLEEDPTTNDVLYQGKAQLYKSTNGGSSWNAISSFNPANSNDNNLVEVAIAPNNNQVIYAAYRHQVFRTNDGGSTWTDVSPPYSFSNVNYLSVHPTDDQRALIVLSGANEKVAETTDQGSNWTDITGTLPNVSAQSAIYEGSSVDGIYVSMNPGIFYKDNNFNTNWTSYFTGMPNVNVTELEIRNNFIYAGTYGRGLWKNDLFVNIACNINSVTDLGTEDCDNNLGTYSRVLEINYNGPPNSGTLDVNNLSFTITGSPQIVFIPENLDGNAVNVDINFSAEPSCSLSNPNLYTNPVVCPCIIDSANETLLTCDGFSTGTVDDDIFTFSLDPTGSHIGTSYSVSGDVTATNINYGSAQVFDNGGAGFLVTSGDLNLILTDDDDPTCSLSVVIAAPVSCSENYTCATANIITNPGIHTAIGPNQGNGGSNSGRHANWFSYVPPTDGLLSVHSCLMGVDTRLFVHDGSCGTLNQLITSDDVCPMFTGGNSWASEILDYCVTGGTTYYIEWDDRWSMSGFNFEVLFSTTLYYLDNDGDGFGDPATVIGGCSPPSGYILDGTDCDDTDPNINPNGTEICDGIDNNCDGAIDEGFTSISYYADTDGDGFGDPTNSMMSCTPITGYVSDNTDCDDSNVNVNPGVAEICDGIDNNCDGNVDEGLTTTYFLDNDGDGFGDSNNSMEACTPPSGYVVSDTDCDDNDVNNYPGNTEVCDGADNNCDGIVDGGCGNAPACDDIYLVINTLTMDVYRAEINVSSDATISNNNPVLFTAGTDIDLTADFEVTLGTEFEARIEPCVVVPSNHGSDVNFGIQDLDKLMESLSEKTKKQLRVRLITTDGEIIYEKTGEIGILKEVKRISEDKSEKLILTLKFL